MPLIDEMLEKFRRGEAETAGGNLSRKRKLAVAGLAIFGVFMFIFWAVSLKNNIYNPLNPKNSGQEISNNKTSASEAAKKQDTDKDGLTDFDETNFYNTSPYLEDSDSDGIPDGLEVKNKTNPNCPEGRDCSGAASSAGGEANNSSNLPSGPVAGTASSSELLLDVNAALDEAGLQGIMTGQADAAALRKFLIDGGMEKKLLDQISDKDLMDSYRQMLLNSSSTAQ